MVNWKGGLSKVGKGIAKATETVAKEAGKNLRTMHRKDVILGRMGNKQVYSMANHYGIRPQPDMFDGSRPTISDYESAIKWKLSLSEIIRYAKRNGIFVRDVEIKMDDEQSSESINEMRKKGLIKEGLMDEVINVIRAFKPFKRYNSEYPYQIELGQFLKQKFPMTDIEKQKGSSRPDIIVGDVAIEVKGPTYKEGLDSILSKCVRYPNHYKGGLIVVLFTPRVTYRYYNDWLAGMKRTFPEVVVIKKQ